jgi:TPR repeat protein
LSPFSRRLSIIRALNIVPILTICLVFILAPGCRLASFFQSGSSIATQIAQPPGEEEFLAQNYQAATSLLSRAAGQGNIRAIFYLRIIYEHGLDGGPIRPQLAQLALNYLAPRYAVLEELAHISPKNQIPLYQTAMATLLYLGRGQKPDLERALGLASQAANANFPPAINLMTALTMSAHPEKTKPSNLSVSSNLSDPSDPSNLSDPSDPSKPSKPPFTSFNYFNWAQQGAKNKDVLAMGNLSSLYRRGLGDHQNKYSAAIWAHAAATAPCPSVRAQNDLGYFYEMGLGLAKDLEEAVYWYKLAAARAYPLAKANLKRLTTKKLDPKPTTSLVPIPAMVSDDLEY